MELFERIRYLAEIKEISLSKISKKLNIPQQTFNQWLKVGSQKNLWEHLPKILEIFPDIRPEWLYMGQEPVFRTDASAQNSVLEERVKALENELQRLQKQIFVDKADGGAIARAAGQE